MWKPFTRRRPAVLSLRVTRRGEPEASQSGNSNWLVTCSVIPGSRFRHPVSRDTCTSGTVRGNDLLPVTRIFVTVCVLVALVLAVGCTAPQARKATAQTAAATPALQESYRQAVDMMQAGQWPEARQLLEDITAAHATLAGPWLNLGIVYTRLGESQAAESAFRRSIDNNPGNPVAYNQLGIFYRRTGRLGAARETYNAALGAAPDDPDTHWNLAILHDLYLPDTRLALYHYERYQQLTGSDDAQLMAWISELRQRVPVANMNAGVNP